MGLRCYGRELHQSAPLGTHVMPLIASNSPKHSSAGAFSSACSDCSDMPLGTSQETTSASQQAASGQPLVSRADRAHPAAVSLLVTASEAEEQAGPQEAAVCLCPLLPQEPPPGPSSLPAPSPSLQTDTPARDWSNPLLRQPSNIKITSQPNHKCPLQ